MLVLFAALFIGGYQLGHGGQRLSEQELSEIKALRELNLTQQQQLVELKRSTQINLDALAIRLGEMQAQAERLDALGGRLTLLAGIDDSEFQFSQAPALGGLDAPIEDQQRRVVDVDSEIDKLVLKMQNSAYKLDIMQAMLQGESVQNQYIPNGRPVKSGWLSSRFGIRTDPINGKKAMHHGLDFSGAMGTDVLSVADGVVTWSGKRSGYGNLVEIDHGNGYQTRYAHNQKTLVKVGERVVKGQKIALMGKSGRATGPHVHFEVLRLGHKIDPMPFIKSKKS